MLPRNVFMVLFCLLLFMQNLFLIHQQLVILLVARIRLLWILDVLIQLRRRRHRRSFYPYWIFPCPTESWFEIHLHQRHFPETLFRRNMPIGRESFDALLRLLKGLCSEREHSPQKLYTAWEVIRSRSTPNFLLFNEVQ